jgi:hypothetical protein
MMRAAIACALCACAGAAPRPKTISNAPAPRELDRSIRAVAVRELVPSCCDEVDVDPLVYADVDGDGAEDAIAIVKTTEAPHVWDEARVFARRRGEITLIATIPGGDRADGGIDSIHAEPGGLAVGRDVKLEGAEARACDCAASVTVELWRWDGNALVQVAK